MLLAHNPILGLPSPDTRTTTDPFSRILLFPPFLTSWPYHRRVNPHRLSASHAASEWFVNCDLLPPSAQRVFEKYDSGLLAALAYPNTSEAHLRIVCDALNIVLLFDDYSDTQPPLIVRALANEILNGFGASIKSIMKPELTFSQEQYLRKFGNAARSFWSRAAYTLPTSCQRRFVSAFTTYCAAIVQQAYDRTSGSGPGNVRNVDSYIVQRRETIGARLAFALVDVGLDENEDEKWLFENPYIIELENAAIDIISFANDAYSYDREQAQGDEAHNMLTCIMRGENVSLQEAMNTLGQQITALEERFSELSIRTLGSVASSERFKRSSVGAKSEKSASCSVLFMRNRLTALTTYIDALGNWVRANDAWSFESIRYFGEKGAEVQKNRCIVLR